MREASEALSGILVSMEKVQEPRLEYGRMKLDLDLNLELIGAVQLWAAREPAATAETIRDVISEYDLDWC